MKINFSQHYLSNLSNQLKNNRGAIAAAIPKIDYVFNMTPQNEALQTWQNLNERHNNVIVVRWYQLLRLKYPKTNIEPPANKFPKSTMNRLNQSQRLTFLYRRLCEPFLMRYDHLNNNYQSRQDGLAEIEKQLLKIASSKSVSKKDNYSPTPPTARL